VTAPGALLDGVPAPAPAASGSTLTFATGALSDGLHVLSGERLILEDDYDAEFRYDREPIGALQGLAPEHIVYAGSASKTLAPALRLAWVVPPSHLIDDVEDVLLVTGVTPPTLDQVALASFIENAKRPPVRLANGRSR